MGDDEPKYLNSPETPVFSKRRTFYGLDRARDAIRKRANALPVQLAHDGQQVFDVFAGALVASPVGHAVGLPIVLALDLDTAGKLRARARG